MNTVLAYRIVGAPMRRVFRFRLAGFSRRQCLMNARPMSASIVHSIGVSIAKDPHVSCQVTVPRLVQCHDHFPSDRMVKSELNALKFVDQQLVDEQLPIAGDVDWLVGTKDACGETHRERRVEKQTRWLGGRHKSSH